MLIDTHCHLNFPDYENNLEAIVKNSLKFGVKKIICVSSNIADSRKAIELTKRFPKIVYAAVGIHPQNTNPSDKTPIASQIAILEKMATENNVTAIGECGLDYSPVLTQVGPAPPKESDRPKEEQAFLFKKQIELAIKHHLPISVHTREAFNDTIEILKEYPDIKGVIHCYSAGRKGIARVQETNFYFGVDGNLTYDSGLQNVVANIPLSKILLETDAPFLSPVPYRNLRNEPGNVKIIAETLAKIKGTSLVEVGKITSDNASRLFGLNG